MGGQAIHVGDLTLQPVTLMLGVAGVFAVVVLALLVMLIVNMVQRSRERAKLESELSELKGRMHTMAEVSISRQSDLARAVNDRLDKVSHRLGQNLTETSRKTADSLSKLHERLAVIDTAQKNITELSSNVVTLQQILSNKQARGAYGQGRMETIIQDGLHKDAYSFQATLSNGKRPDCLIKLPNAPGLVIDAKFPLEGFEALREATSDEARTQAARRIRQDVSAHVSAIGERYFIAGETQDTALMFVPSEAVYAELHEQFPDLLQKASRARIVIVSPNMLMLAVQTMQAIMKDVKMREQAGLIQKEVAYLMADVHRLRERVLDLQRHFGMANKDIEKILTSSDRISNRGRRIENMEFDDSEAVEDKSASGDKSASVKKRGAQSRGKKSAPAAAEGGNGGQADFLTGE